MQTEEMATKINTAAASETSAEAQQEMPKEEKKNSLCTLEKQKGKRKGCGIILQPFFVKGRC